MSYIQSNLLEDEQILFRTKKSLIIFFWPVVWLVFSIIATKYMLDNAILNKMVWAPWAMTFIFWSYRGLDYLTSEYAVTTKRVMMREGFFTRHSNETRLAAISQVNVDQTLIGVILNYGVVSINAFGAFDAFPMIAKPFYFQKCVNQQLDRVVRT